MLSWLNKECLCEAECQQRIKNTIHVNNPPSPKEKGRGGGGGCGGREEEGADPPEAKMPVPVHANTPPLGHPEHLPPSQANGNHVSLKLKISPKPAGCSQWTGVQSTSPPPNLKPQ